MTFDKARWDSGAGNYDGKNPRLELVSSLGAAGLVIGAPRTTVHRLLGAPDAPSVTDKNAEGWYLGRNDMAPDFLTLTIRYDDKDKVTAIKTNNS